ncbi:MAG: hypothetical protein J3K34DRAFT_492834 [Monoraphidium minutum]|nr:MAG: hypothetical protein J3K34DRAFT_492834 [Monoraphidium minutum]
MEAGTSTGRWRPSTSLAPRPMASRAARPMPPHAAAAAARGRCSSAASGSSAAAPLPWRTLLPVCERHRRPLRERRAPVRVSAEFEAAEAATSSGIASTSGGSGGGGGAAEAPEQQRRDAEGQQQQQQQQRAGGGGGGGGAAARDVRSFDLRLPPSVSATTGLDALDDVELQQQAQDWGYTQLGRPFPEEVPLSAVAESLDPRHFEIDLKQALLGLVASFALIAAGCAWQAHMHAVCPLWQRLLCWLAAGTGYFGAFQAAVDCAHFAFWPQEPAIQDAVGALLMAPALVPYEGWRLQYFNHLMCPNMLGQDSPLWHPLTAAEVASMPRWRRALARLATATPLRFLARALVGWAAAWDGLDLRRHPPAARRWVLLSWAAPAAFAALALPALLAGGGLERLVGWWLMPWLVFLGWQGLVATAQSTAPHIPFVPEGLEYDHGQAVVNGTVTLDLPRWLEPLVGAANLTLPRTLSISIPWYRLRGAHEELRAKLGPYLTEAPLLSPTLLLNLSTRWLVFDGAARRYTTFDGAAAAAEPAAEPAAP